MKMWPTNSIQTFPPKDDHRQKAGAQPPAKDLTRSAAPVPERSDLPEPTASVEGTPMADIPAINFHENTPEQIAYKLFLHIVAREEASLAPGHGKNYVDRFWILSTYAECMKAVKQSVPA
jgi:hypothetical protein